MPRPTVTPAAALVAELRRRRGLTQKELAEKAGYSKKTVERIEAGSNTHPATLNDVATVLGVASTALVASVHPAAGPGGVLVYITVRGIWEHH